jgi:hypothetical protein
MCERAQARAKIAVGDRFGRWTVLSTEATRRGSRGDRYLPVRCTCGTLGEVTVTNLHHGQSLSCGCLCRERVGTAHRTHGESHGTREYERWHRMHSRCNDVNDKNYGGRGITVCRRWHKYENFLLDMGRCPPGMTLDRRNNAKGYTPANCRWSTPKEQARNRRNSIRLTYKGTTRSLAEWAERLNVYYVALQKRYYRGLPPDQILDVTNLRRKGARK